MLRERAARQQELARGVILTSSLFSYALANLAMIEWGHHGVLEVNICLKLALGITSILFGFYMLHLARVQVAHLDAPPRVFAAHHAQRPAPVQSAEGVNFLPRAAPAA